jgi:hypothetical protein
MKGSFPTLIQFTGFEFGTDLYYQTHGDSGGK